MTAIELKNILIRRISEINDISFLKAIKTILDSKTDNNVLALTSKQKEEIVASKKEIEKGLFIEHEELEKEVKGWLNAR
jgi:predicted transcriptional regulator